MERVGGGRSGSRPALVVGSLILAFLGLAIAKPWAPPGGDGTASPASPPAVAVASASLGPAPEVTRRAVAQAPWAPVPFVAGPVEAIPAIAVRAAVRLHETWGVRAVVQPVGGALEERWAAASPETFVTLGTGPAPVRALGVTAPSGLLVLDVRVSAIIGGTERWLDAEPVGGANPGSGYLLRPPRIGADWAAAWPAGTYRLDVLTAAGVGTFGVELAGPAELMVDPRPATQRWPGAGVTGFPTLPAATAAGVFIGALPLEPETPNLAPTLMGLGGRQTAGLGYGTAWLDTLSGQASQVTAFGVTAYAPAAVTFGVVAPDGLRVDSGKVVRLRPGLAGGPTGPADRAVGVPTDIEGRAGVVRQAVRFDEPDGRAWEPGTYAILVDGVGPNGHDTVGYLLTLLPGSARTTAVPLAATRAWARFSGRWGIAAGLLEPLDAPGRLAIRYAATPPEAVVSGGADFTTRCLEVNLIDTGLPILGIGHPTGIRPGAVEVQRVYLDGSVSLARPVTALSVLPGLTMVAPPEGSAWSPGWYRMVVHTDTARLGLPVCVGSSGPGYLTVPSDAGTRSVAAAGAG